MITLLGVGHVFDIAPAVRLHILRRGPAVVGLELDAARWHALTHRDEAREAPFAVRLLAGFQERIARDYGGQVGDEMLSAAGAAREVGARLALIDQDSRLLLPRLWKSLPFEERVKAAVAVLTGLFVRKKSVERELKRYEADQKAYLDEFSQQFPTIRRILIDERDEHMAAQLRTLEAQHGRIVAVIGDGHVEGVRARLADLQVEVVRLQELRETPPATGSEFSFSVTTRTP